MVACAKTLSPTVGGVFVLTLCTLFYGAWRRRQMRRLFELPGSVLGDLVVWLFCTQCALCQEYRTMKGCRVEGGAWGGGAPAAGGGTQLRAPNPYVEMI